jgi:hypothetical protein
MQGVNVPQREKAILQSLLKIVEDPRVFVGMQFMYRPPRKLDQERVEIRELEESGEMFTVKRVDGDDVYEEVGLDQLRIGRGRAEGEPLMDLLSQHGFDPTPYLQREEFRTPTGRSGSVPSSPRIEPAGREIGGGFRPPSGVTPLRGFIPVGVEVQMGAQETRGQSGDRSLRKRRTPFGQFEAVKTGQARPGPFAPASTRRRQVPFQEDYRASPRVPLEAPIDQYQGAPERGFHAPQQFGQAAGAYPYAGQQGVPPVGGYFHGHGYGRAGGFFQHNQPYVPDPVAPARARAPGFQQPGWGETPVQVGARGGESRQGFVQAGSGRRSPIGQDLEGGRQGAGSAESTKAVLERLAEFKKKLNKQSSRTGIEAELRRQQAQISQEKNRGLFAQMDIASTIYSAPEKWKGIIALSGGLSAVLKLPTSKLAFLGDELVSTDLHKCREAGENLTDEQVASIENAVLEIYRAKKAKAEELMARNPDWARKGEFRISIS